MTLVEVLVVVAVLSILGVSLYTVFKSGADAWEAAVERLEVYQNARFVLDQMTRELAEAITPTAQLGSGPAFRGRDRDNFDDADEITFATNYSDSIYTIHYQTILVWQSCEVQQKMRIFGNHYYIQMEHGE